MRGEVFADVLLILLVSSVIFVILSLVNRANKKTSNSKDDTSAEQNQNKPR